MKKTPIYISQVIMYILIGIGLYNFIESYKEIMIISIPAETQAQTNIPIIPLVIVSVVIFIILTGVGLQLLGVFWEWFKVNKTAIMFPILAVAVGVLQLVASLMLFITIYIETNTTQFITNLNIYVDSCTNLMWWIIAGIIAGLIGLGWSVISKYIVVE
jgi:hypothetical protein